MTNVFNRSYRFYEKGAPYPGICSTCSNTEKLWDLGMVRGTNQGLYVCDSCLTELALFAGFVLKTKHNDTVKELQTQIKELTNKLNAAPALLRKLNENVSALLADFVTDLAAVPSKPASPHVENPETSPNIVSPNYRNKPQAGEGKKQSPKPSPKPTRS